ncbi:MAG: hypothetical protein H7289_07855 [Mucilaginibacter sp.]|nr:hypothetical protein [Mucilaginibacter sp.]
MKNLKALEEITPEVIEAWKSEHKRGVWQLSVDGKVGYVRKPTRDEMKYAMTFATKNDPLGMVEEILKSCWLGGDDDLINDDDFFYGAAEQLQTLIEIKAGELKKL